MNLRLISNPDEATEQRIVRMRNDVIALGGLTRAEIRARYEILEAIRDRLSLLLDRVDGKA